MTFHIRHDGKLYLVHTEVGNGLTRVIFDEDTDAAGRDSQGEKQPAADRSGAEARNP